jgi:hypothetical protein
VTLVRMFENDTSWAGRVRPIRYKPGGNAAVRSTSRHRRRALLRSTAIPECRPMANATRGPSRAGSNSMVHQRTPLRTRVPSRRSRANSSRLWSRPIKPTAACDPSGAGPSTQLVRRGWTCAPGSHASRIDASYWVGTYASRQTPRFLMTTIAGEKHQVVANL